jgi:hypothetical protein
MLRRTEHINRKVVQNLFRAFDFAKAGGAPLNVTTVINFRDTPELSAATAFEHVRHKFRDWLSHHGKKLGVRLPPQYVYTFENVGHIHANWVLRVRPSLIAEFKTKLPRWLKKVQGTIGPYDIEIREVDVETGYKSLAGYIAKGCDPAFAEHFYLGELKAQHGPQGEFWGKRAGISPALNKTARRAADYDDKQRKFRSREGEVAASRRTKSSTAA